MLQNMLFNLFIFVIATALVTDMYTCVAGDFLLKTTVTYRAIVHVSMTAAISATMCNTMHH